MDLFPGLDGFDEIHTNQGKNSDGNLFASVCELLHIVKNNTL